MAEYRTDREIAKRMRSPPARRYGGKRLDDFSDMEKEVQKQLFAKQERKKQMAHELEIKLEDKYVVEIRLDQSVFTVEVDRNGRPKFTESVLEKVPPYIRRLIKDILPEMRYGPNRVHKCLYVDAHQESCSEAKGLGRCNCEPASVSYTSKKPIQQLGIRIEDESVELKYGESLFKFGLKRYRDFPESVDTPPSAQS